MALFDRSLMDVFGFTSQKEKDAQLQAYKELMFPFGDEEKQLITKLFRRAIRVNNEHKVMFVFLAIKETYLEGERDGLSPADCAQKAHRKAPTYHMVPKNVLPFIFTLAMQDLNLTSLEEMPSVEQVLELQKQIFPGGYSNPQWTALPERNNEHGKEQ